MKKGKLSFEDKYELYESSVQNPECDIDFINQEFKKMNNRKPLTVREDFGGTGMMSNMWVTQSSKHFAYAVDLDPEPIEYGKKNHYTKLNKNSQKRMKYVLGNVLEERDFKVDVAVAFNFSYFIFKERKTLLKYFKKVKKGLKKEGMFFLDIFGGYDSMERTVEETDHGKFSYFWDCDSYNPLTSECLYYIHFKDNKKNIKYERAFTYDWRMWSPQELVELLEEAGFKDVNTYWEEDGDDGDGNGVFYKSKKEENCPSWVTYVVARV
ncbi:MAG: class I SAM-dependent methyltransferase [Bacteriovoracaceae bacterium]